MDIVNLKDMILFIEGDTVIMKRVYHKRKNKANLKLEDIVKDDTPENLEEVCQEVKKYRKSRGSGSKANQHKTKTRKLVYS